MRNILYSLNLVSVRLFSSFFFSHLINFAREKQAIVRRPTELCAFAFAFTGGHVDYKNRAFFFISSSTRDRRRICTSGGLVKVMRAGPYREYTWLDLGARDLAISSSRRLLWRQRESLRRCSKKLRGFRGRDDVTSLHATSDSSVIKFYF